MRIAVPTTNGHLEQHFGHCSAFTIFDVDRENSCIDALRVVEAPKHEPGQLPPWLKERGVEFLIVGNMGTRAKDLCEELSIGVLTGAPESAPDFLVRSYLSGSLFDAGSDCGHDSHSCHH